MPRSWPRARLLRVRVRSGRAPRAEAKLYAWLDQLTWNRCRRRRRGPILGAASGVARRPNGFKIRHNHRLVLLLLLLLLNKLERVLYEHHFG